MGQYGGVIGGAVGAFVGFWIGGTKGAQWGWAAGSTLGGAYSTSQQVIPGPQIGDIQQQTAQEGGPRPIVFGRSPPIAGNVIADGGPKKVTRRERQGKGGPKVETESIYRTYAVAVCEGPIRAFLQVWRNNTLVYDVEDPSMSSENAEFRKYARFFLGGYDQMPSPDLEGVLGAGNVTAHRGTAYIVLADEDVTDLRGMWSQWKFRVDAQQPEAYLTSKVYPLLSNEGMSTGSQFADAILRDTRRESENEEEMSYGFGFETATLRIPLVDSDSHEALGYGVGFGTAILRNPLISAGTSEEELSISMGFPNNAILRQALIKTESQEETSISITFEEASLYAP